MDKRLNLTLLAARLGLGAIFFVSGLGKLTSWAGTAAYAGAKGVPELLLAGAVALEIAGGLSLLAGAKTRWGVAALLVFLVPATLLFHGFWAYAGGEAHLQSIQFLKNVSIGGGLLALLGAGPGALSVDGLLELREAGGRSRAAAQAA
jgi:putative oxidoreductase